MENKHIITIVFIIIILFIILFVSRKIQKENFQYLTRTDSIQILPTTPIVSVKQQPHMFLTSDSQALTGYNYIKPSNNGDGSDGYSMCNWFKAGNIVNVNYNTSVACKGTTSGTDFGLMYFYLDVKFTRLPLFTSNTNVTGSGVYTLIGYGNNLLLNNDNYKALQNGTVMLKKMAANTVRLCCVQHYPGPPIYLDSPNDYYTYNITIQFSYNII